MCRGMRLQDPMKYLWLEHRIYAGGKFSEADEVRMMKGSEVLWLWPLEVENGKKFSQPHLHLRITA